MRDLVSQTRLAPYFAALERGDFELAVSRFAMDAVYVRPSYEPSANGMGMVSMRGRDAILEFFRQRGVRSDHHEVLVYAADATTCIIEGIARDTAFGTVMFMSSAQFDDDDLIARYVSLAAPAPPQTVEVVESSASSPLH